MAAQSFGDVYRRLRLHAPAVPLFLAQAWVQEAWQELCDTRSFSFLRGEMTLLINASRSVAATFTLNSKTVTSAALFTATDAGRQIRLSGGQTYVIDVYTDASTLQLDRVYGDASVTGGTATIFDGYAVMPNDFAYFTLIPDLYTSRRLAFWIGQDELNLLDPKRLNSDYGPRCLSAFRPSQRTATLGQMLYEYWPYPTAQRSYPARYMKNAPTLTESSTFWGVLNSEAVEKLCEGALVRCARWPGLTDQKNPYFNLQLAESLNASWQQSKQSLSLSDDNMLGDDQLTVNWAAWPLMDLAFNDRSLRAMDASSGDFY